MWNAQEGLVVASAAQNFPMTYKIMPQIYCYCYFCVSFGAKIRINYRLFSKCSYFVLLYSVYNSQLLIVVVFLAYWFCFSQLWREIEKPK